MPAVGAAIGPVGVAEIGVGLGVGVLELELEELGVATGVEEEGKGEELLDEMGVLEADDESELLLGVKELLLEELALSDIEVTAGVEVLLEDVSMELLALVAMVLIDKDVDEGALLLGATELSVGDRVLEEVEVEDKTELLLALEVLALVDEIVEVAKLEEDPELDMLEDVVELVTATAMTLAPQTPLLLGVPTPLFK